MVAAEGQIGVGGTVLNGGGPGGCPRGRRRRRSGGGEGISGGEAGRLRQGGNPLHAKRRFTGVVQSSFESYTRIVGSGTRIGRDRGSDGGGVVLCPAQSTGKKTESEIEMVAALSEKPGSYFSIIVSP